MQLHELVDAVTGDEPRMARTADDIIAAGRRAERRRRAGFASAGAAGLVVVAVAGVFALPSFGAGDTQVSPAPVGAATSGTVTDPFTFTFRGYDAGPLHVQDPIAVSTAYQIAPVYSDGHTSNDKPLTVDEAEALADMSDGQKKSSGGKPSLWAYLTVYRPGAFDPAGIKDGTDVTVAGRKAVQATLPAGLDPQHPAAGGNKLFAWEYAGNAWAAVTSYSSDRVTPSFDDLGGLVAGLKLGAPAPALVPFTVGYVPDGYAPLQTGTHAMPGLSGIATARAGDYGGATYTRPAAPASGLTAPYDAAKGTIKDGFHIIVTPSAGTSQSPEPGATRCVDVPERMSGTGGPTGGFCTSWSADGKVAVQVTTTNLGNKLPRGEVEKVARGITVADVQDESTWVPAGQALRP